MNWKANLQLSDLDVGAKLEMTCRTCGHVHYQNAADLLREEQHAFLYLDEVEKMTVCKARGCRSGVRLALWRDEGQASGFVGGLA